MELREYWTVVQRYWKLIALLGLVVLVVSTGLALRGPTAYKAEYTLAVSVPPEPRMGPYFTFAAYYEWLASEYLADDLSRIIESQAFAEDVSEVLGIPVASTSVSDVTRVRKTHRMLDVTITDADPSRAMAIARAHEQVLNEKLGGYLAQLRSESGHVRMINQPTVSRATTTLGMAAEIGLRTLVGLMLGAGLAFVLNYVDGTIRGRSEAEQLLETRVLGEIPSGSGLA